MNKKHLKNVEPILYCEPFYIVIHQVSLLPPLSHAACASMSTTTTTTTTTRDRGDRYGPMEWAQLRDRRVPGHASPPSRWIRRRTVRRRAVPVRCERTLSRAADPAWCPVHAGPVASPVNNLLTSSLGAHVE